MASLEAREGEVVVSVAVPAAAEAEVRAAVHAALAEFHARAAGGVRAQAELGSLVSAETPPAGQGRADRIVEIQPVDYPAGSSLQAARSRLRTGLMKHPEGVRIVVRARGDRAGVAKLVGPAEWDETEFGVYVMRETRAPRAAELWLDLMLERLHQMGAEVTIDERGGKR